uniref:Protein CutA n=1 Tax=Leptobrachium leishanense TaxID=445787 RepID=A0A8C5MLU4_9ANUR
RAFALPQSDPIGSCVTYPVLQGLYYQIHSTLTGSYIPGSHSAAFINCPNEEVAKDIARYSDCCGALYIWKGEIEESTEVLVNNLLFSVETCTQTYHGSLYFCRIRVVHPFEVPDLVSIPIDQGNADYFKWIEKVVEENKS